MRTRLAGAQISTADVDRKFIRPDGQPRSANYIASVLVREATKFDFSATSEYREWDVKVRGVRNDIVHGKRFDVTRSEATEAYEAVIAAISLLQSK